LGVWGEVAERGGEDTEEAGSGSEFLAPRKREEWRIGCLEGDRLLSGDAGGGNSRNRVGMTTIGKDLEDLKAAVSHLHQARVVENAGNQEDARRDGEGWGEEEAGLVAWGLGQVQKVPNRGEPGIKVKEDHVEEGAGEGKVGGINDTARGGFNHPQVVKEIDEDQGQPPREGFHREGGELVAQLVGLVHLS